MHQFHPIEASQNIKESFIDYITTSFGMADEMYAEKFRKELERDGYIAKGPYLDVSGSYKTANSIRQLIASSDASPLFEDLEPIHEKDREFKMERPLYCHQQQALLKANAGNNLVVTTGTGSGKTECFLIPIVNALLREKEAGTLDDGVRAIIIYPMNALANDQIKRMRSLLKNYPAITFGLYNGNTRHEESDALHSYRKANGKDAVPLRNEMISRSRMQKTAPHILITNYSMLEYMMLRPKDDTVFSGAKLRYIVLDEAHVYKGTTGMETAMLMRRLRARISTRDTVQYILTSATLGGQDADDAIISFANRLCGVSFKAENIIRSQDATPPMREELDVPSQLFSDLNADSAKACDVFRKYGLIDYAPDGDDSEKFYELLLHCKIFRHFVDCTRQPKTILELREELCLLQPITTDQLIAFIAVCTKAEKGKTSLIKAKYHFFVRSLEGAYITLNEPKQLFLHRQEKVKNGTEEQTVFEIAVCTDCGRLAIVGKEDENGYFKQVARKTDSDPKECEFYLLDDGSLGSDTFDNEDENEGDDDNISEENDYVICPVCGRLASKGDLRFGKICDCDVNMYVPLKKVKRTKTGIAKCAACGFGSLRAFYLGNDAATAVLGTELYEQLPDEEIVQNQAAQTTSEKPGEFNLFTANKSTKKAKAKKMRQFLCFSDSRSEAACFANNLEKSYQEFLRRRAFLQVADQLKKSGKTDISVKAFVDKLTRFFDANQTFAVWKPNTKEDKDQIHQDSESNAWIAVLNEMFNARRGTSLPSLGLISFDYTPNTGFVDVIADAFKLQRSDAKALLNQLAMDAVYLGAIDTGGAMMLSPAEREYIFFTETPKRLVLRKPSESKRDSEKSKSSQKKKPGVEGWAGHTRINGNYFPNSRMQRVILASGCTPEYADKFLENYWQGVFDPEGEEYVLNAADFHIKLPGDPELKFYRCRKCGRLTAYNVKNHCASVKCDGKLEEIDPAVLNKDNHYIRLYRSPQMQSLQIKEHTAQLSKTQQTLYQQAFVNKDINALSCSTTFEMGVDVGGLETVYMRNVPPTPANYVQRAGRAGRAMHTAAFVLTYAKLSSHDLTFYQNPSKIISGTIQAPVFELENEKVIARHIYAVALSKFFARNEDVYAGDNQSFLLNEGGYERLVEYLKSKPDDLKDLLKKSIPPQLHNRMGIDDYSWTEKLIGDDGTLKIAVDEFRSEVKLLEQDLKYLKKTDLQAAAAAERALKQFRCGPEDEQHKKSLIEFLVRNNVLPKYGFPVDTVELQVNYSSMNKDDETLQLARDLQMAIAEYAPGAEVIADGQRYVSRYIRKLPGKDNSSAWNKGFYCRCPHCEEPNYRCSDMDRRNHPECISCGGKIPRVVWQSTLEPRRGFWTEGKPTPAPIRRPERDYKTDDYYVGDIQRKQIDKQLFEVNGRYIELESTANDTLAVVGLTNYRVCPVCGFATDDVVPMVHKNARGSFCANKEGIGKEYRLAHTFKTFVAKISFLTLDALDYDTMLSVMYALLEGLSQELGIERTDLKGCLHQILWTGSNRPIYSIILYDAVAGGAGHVRRLITEDAAVFQRVLKKALSIVKNCNCNPSCYQCLRNYYNSRIHDQLDRFKAADFLQKWVGDYVPATVGEKTEPDVVEHDGIQINSEEQSVLEYANWAEYGEAYDIMAVKQWDTHQIPRDCLTFPEMTSEGKLFAPDFLWKKQKIAVFEPYDMDETAGLTQQGWHCYPVDADPSEIAKLFKE